MKKTMNFFAAAVMVSLAAVACSKDNGGNKNNNDDDSNADVEGIVIDGNFDDWAKLPEADVVTLKVDAEASEQALRTLKFYDTDEILYVYAECDPAQVATECDMNRDTYWKKNTTQRPLRFVWDTDNNAETGGYYRNVWSDAGFDALLDVYIYADAGKVKAAWSEFWNYKETAEAGKNFVDNIAENETLRDQVVSVANVAGTLVKGWYSVELAIDKVNFPNFGKTMNVASTLMNSNWSEPGLLPSDTDPVKLTLK